MIRARRSGPSSGNSPVQRPGLLLSGIHDRGWVAVRRRAAPATYRERDMSYASGLRQRLHRRPGIVAGGGGTGWPAGERGSLLREQVRPRLHRRTGRRGEEDHRLAAPHPRRGARHRHRVAPTRGDVLRGREHPVDLRVLREPVVGQRAARRAEEASGRLVVHHGRHPSCAWRSAARRVPRRRLCRLRSSP